MKAIRLHEFTGPDGLRLDELPDPVPATGQVLVRMRAFSLNFRDLMMCKGVYNPKARLPCVPVSDGAGEVVAIGPGVTRFKPGERVVGSFMPGWVEGPPDEEKARSALGGGGDGLLAELAVLPEQGLLPVPAHLSLEEAATLPCAAVTAWHALVESGGMKPGDSVLVQGTGGVSLFALQFAHLAGARAIVTSKSDVKLKRAIEMGASHGINYQTTPDWDKRVRELTGGKGVDLIVEVGGAGTLPTSLKAIRVGGTIALIGVLSGGGEINPVPILMKNVRVQGIFVGSRKMFEAMNRAIETAQLHPVIDRVFGFDQVKEAMKYMESGAHFGKSGRSLLGRAKQHEEQLSRPRSSLGMTASHRSLLAAALGIVALAAAAALGQDQSRDERGKAGNEHGAELPRFPLKDAAESQKTIAVRHGFRVELAAAEPLLQSPVAIDFDEDGRLYVAEFPEYNQYANPKYKGKGCIRLLEDTQGDGVYDKSTLFADQVPRASAVACWDGGVYVGSAPDLLYFKDTSGDGKADVRRVVFTGFGSDPAGEGMLNSFRWGLDNRFHISTSLDGGLVRPADRHDAKTVSVRGHVFLFDPRGESFELTGGGGQHGMSMDDWGRAYVCGNSDPFQLVMYDSRYLARNPHLQAPPAAVNIAPAGKFTKLHRISPVEPWRVLRTRLRREGLVSGSDEGGSPSGFFTGGTGVTVYRGDAFPPEFRGNLFVGDVSNNVIHRALAVASGVLITAQSAESGREFLAAGDTYFRPVQMANGPDGWLWVVDMYRELIEGAAFLPSEVLKHMDVASGVDRGRIWRVGPEGGKPRIPRLSKATTVELVALLDHANGWHRDTASRLLYQRQDKSAVKPLRHLAMTAKTPLGRAHALHALAGVGALLADDVRLALSDPEPRVREDALRLGEPFCRDDERIRNRMEELIADVDSNVRFQLAFSLGALPGSRPVVPLAALALRDGADSWMRMAILSSASECTGELFHRLAATEAFRGSRHGQVFLATLAAQAGAAGSANDLAAVVNELNGTLAGNLSLSDEIVLALLSNTPAASQARLVAAGGGRLGPILARLLTAARATAADVSQPVDARAAAVESLRFATFDDVQFLLAELLGGRQPLAVQSAAILALARFDDERAAAILLRAWAEMSPKVRATAAEALFARPAWAEAFLGEVEKGTIGRADIDAARVELLKKYPAAGVRARAERIFGAPTARRRDVVAAYQKSLQLKGDRGRGKAIFKEHCSACHRLEGVGRQLGADLAAIRDRGLDAVLLNILDPNREALPQYQSYVLATTDGRVVTGMIAAETANSLTIRKPDGGDETVPRHKIEELRGTGLSFMPEGLEKQIDVPAMADLLAYLSSSKP